MLTELSKVFMQQNSFIRSDDARGKPLMEALDKINDRVVTSAIHPCQFHRINPLCPSADFKVVLLILFGIYYKSFITEC